MRKFLFILSLLSILLSSCQDDDSTTYKVNDTLNEYLQRFLTEAKLRGHTFNLQESGLIMKFGDLEDNVAGRCYYENPIRIVFDTEYWNNITGAQNADEIYEDLVFHELGHGLLLRSHKNAYLSNGDWASIMCGGDEVDGRSWNINYRGIRREYYLDELFNASTAEPYWTTQSTKQSLSTDTLIFADNFSTITQNWAYGYLTNYSGTYNNGIYSFTNNLDEGYLVPVLKDLPLETSQDFYIEARIKFTSSSADDMFGLIFGSCVTPIYVNYFTINNNSRMFMGNTKTYGYYTELTKSQIANNDFNVIGLRKVGQNLYYFINGECVYYDQLTETQYGSDYGFEVPGNSTLQIDYFYVYANNTSFKKATTKTVSSKEPKVFSIKKHKLDNK